MLKKALEYASLGWYVFPVEPPELGGKRPVGRLTPNGKDDATIDYDRIIQWWSQGDWNIGVNLARSGLVVLDVDVSDGKRGLDSLKSLDADLTPTLTARTGSGGFHAIYSRPTDLTEQTAPQQIGIREGLDLIGKGYVVAAPSKHACGGLYEWVNQIPVAPLPQVLRSLKRERIANLALSREQPNPSGLDKPAKIIAAGRLASNWPTHGRHSAYLALAGCLAQHGWPADEIAEFTRLVASLTPNGDIGAKRDAQARDSVTKVQTGEPVAGWNSLATYLPDDVIREVQKQLHCDNLDLDWQSIEQETNHLIAAHTDDDWPQIKFVDDLAQIDYPPVISYSTGIRTLDEMIGGGISTQQLFALIGRPSTGKSAFVISRILEMSSTVPQLYVTTELQHNEAISRFTAPILLAPWRNILRENATLSDGTTITKQMRVDAISGQSNKRIAIIGQDDIYQCLEKNRNPLELIGKTAQKMKQRFNGQAPVIWVDYIQELMPLDEDPKKAVTRVAATLRTLAQRLDAAIIGISSVARGGYGKAGQDLRALDEPTAYLPMAKESGNIDFVCATIGFLDVLEQSDPNGWRKGRIAIAKSRHGDAGFAGVRFHGATGRFVEDTTALEAMAAPTQEAGKAERLAQETEAKVLAKVTELSLLAKNERGESRLLSKTDLRRLIPVRTELVLTAINKLILEGKLQESSEVRTTINGALRNEKIIMLGPNK